MAAGTHPFSHWQSQLITEHDRYKVLEEDLQDVVRSILIFGLHVHVGMPGPRPADRDHERGALFPAAHAGAFHQLAVLAGARHRAEVLPHDRLAAVPAHGHPVHVQFVGRVRGLCQIAGEDQLHRQRQEDLVGPAAAPLFQHAGVPGLRYADHRRRHDLLVALFQAIVAKLYRLRQQNLGFRLYDRALIMENKWRAARYGIDGKLIDFGKRAEVPMRELAVELLEFVDDVVDELGSREAVNHVHTVLREGTGADSSLRSTAKRAT